MTTPQRRPWGVTWRASPWFTTLVVGCSIATDTLIYSLPVPVVPFQLQHLHYRDVSSLTGWLLFAFSAAGAASTLPIAALSERYSSRQPPLIAGLILLIGSQVMFMEAPTYWVMVLARVIQGISATIVWVVGLALLCDAVPESEVGSRLGLAMIGMPVGLMLGAPVGGALYKAFGFRGPFIFGSGLALVDIVGRLLVIERKDALPWLPLHEAGETVAGGTAPTNEAEKGEHAVGPSAGQDGVAAKVPRLSFLAVCKKMVTSPRAITFAFGVCAIQMTFTMTEPTMPLHLQHIWHLDSTKVGLVNLALVIPALISSPLAGVLCDRIGIKWVVAATTFLAIPWWFVATISKSLVLFVACVAMLSFWISAFIAAAVAECANFSQTNPGVGYAHAYGVQQLAVSIGNGIGPILGGLVYDHAKHGWRDVCFIAAGLSLLVTILTLFFTGETQLLARSHEKVRTSNATTETQ